MSKERAATSGKHGGGGGFKGFWKRVLSLTRKEIRQLLRDKSNLAIGIGLPIALILIFGYGLSLDVTNAPVAVVLEDPSPMAADVVAGLELSAYISPVVVSSMHDAERLMLARRVDAIVRVPNDFSRRLAAGDAQVQLLVHGSEASRALIIRGYVNSTIRQWAQRLADRRGRADRVAAGSVTLVERMWFNSANTSTWYLVPGLIVLAHDAGGCFPDRDGNGAGVGTRHPGSIIRFASAANRDLAGQDHSVLSGRNAGPRECAWSRRASCFQVPMFGSFLIVLGSSMLYMLVALGIGLVISSSVKNQFLASQIALISSFMPALMLSGFLFDLRNVPTVIYLVGQLLPATYFMELIRTLFLAGNVWPLILKNSAILAALRRAAARDWRGSSRARASTDPCSTFYVAWSACAGKNCWPS